MSEHPFSADELRSDRQFSNKIPIYHTPITPKENWKRMLRREHPLWVPMYTDIQTFLPRIVPDNIARVFVYETWPQEESEKVGGKDMFGVDWVYVPSVGGSMEKIGTEFLEDVNDWKDLVHFPDVDSWDWEGCAKRNKDYIDHTRYLQTWIFTGFFERLISFMGFESAVVALIDEDQQDAIHQLFTELSKTYMRIIGNMKRWFGIDGIYFHDDWGGQMAPFFSLNTCREMIGPHLKAVVDFCHANDIFFELHSCGKTEMLAPVMVECGVDAWSGQVMNDKFKLREDYGQSMAIGIQYFPKDDAEMEASIDEMLRKISADYDRKPMYLQNVRPNESMRRYLYTRSRILFDR